MFEVVAAWMTAAKAAVEAALPDAYVTLGPFVNWDEMGGLDVVIIGHDDTADPPVSFSFEGGYRDTGANAVTDGEVRVPVSIYSAAGTTDLDMPARIVAASTLHTAVRDALMPSPALSALGVTGLMWAHESEVVARLIPYTTGPIACLVCTYVLATLV